jgi:hypothetical protein
MARRLLLILIVFACIGSAGDDVPRLEFIRPAHFWPATDVLPLQLRIPRSDQNRLIDVSAFDTADGERVLQSQRDLDGGSPPLQVFKLLLPSGDLILIASLYGVHGRIAKVQTSIQVRSKLGED